MAQYVEDVCTPFIRSGRAVFAVALRGYRERKWPADYKQPDYSTVKYREQFVNWTIDLRRGLDYLETRADIDRTRIAYCGISGGVRFGLIQTAIEPRYRSIVLASGGLRRSWARMIPEARPTNFAPHIRPPKLIINGRYDENVNYRSEIEPFYKLLREPKRQVLYEGGHAPPLDIFVPAVHAFLDETLGPVGR